MKKKCACGCGRWLEDHDTRGRIRSYIVGHSRRGKESTRKVYINRDFLEQKYQNEEERAEDIAKKLGVSETTVLKSIHKYNIPLQKMNRWRHHFDGDFMDLEEDQRQLLIGTLLGDASIPKSTCKESSFYLSFTQKQKEYVEWKINYLSAFFLNNEAKFNKGDDNANGIYYATSVVHPIFAYLAELFYEQIGDKKRRKRVTKDILDMLGDFGLAVWVMDDGTMSRDRINIYTNCFHWEEQEIMQEWFEEKYNIIPKIAPTGRYFYLRFNSVETYFLKCIIEPYILPLFQYKITAESPQLWRDDEIDFLSSNCYSLSDEEIALKLGRTTRGVQSKRIRMGMIREPKWSDSEICLFEKMRNTGEKYEEIAHLLNRTVCSVYHKSSRIKKCELEEEKE